MMTRGSLSALQKVKMMALSEMSIERQKVTDTGLSCSLYIRVSFPAPAVVVSELRGNFDELIQ